MWLGLGFLVALPVFFYFAGIALLDRLLKKQSKPHFVLIKSRQETQCQVSKNAQGSKES